ncbi:hypothetical protein C9J01_01475 [Photobacterium rosenbergii]|uniref:Uncharacterized protein n=1 Tax=Photobacterium rosenbergii TaxID=294936 RepID=A0A2T3NJM1_9GAMM|nr:hypothetical protein [Photobacterium rosenbergii]PSW15715.1 hypothetical protein C9J01_01475 [Photobacterium rosenbergii]
MLQVSMTVAEYVLILAGLVLVGNGIILYGRRTSDWTGVLKMFYNRIGMSAVEFKWYRLGVAALVLGVIIRIVNLTFWPS